MMNTKKQINLSARETEVLQFIYEGFTDGEIAKNLNLSPNTVRTHRENLRRKFQVTNTPSMLRIAIERRLIDPISTS